MPKLGLIRCGLTPIVLIQFRISGREGSGVHLISLGVFAAVMFLQSGNTVAAPRAGMDDAAFLDAVTIRLQRQLAASPYDGKAHYILGETLLKKGRMVDAFNHYAEPV